MEDDFRDYVQPVIEAISRNLMVLDNRASSRELKDWKHAEYMTAAATARDLANDLQWIADAWEFYRDMKAGAFGED